MKRVLLDTNFVLSMFERPRIPFEEEISRVLNDTYTLIVTEQVLKELEGIASSKGTVMKKKKFKAGLEYVKTRCEIVRVENVRKADDSLIYAAEKLKGIVATNDKELRKKLKKKNLRTIFIREGDHLELDCGE